MIVVDVAGAAMGGAAKMATELRSYLSRSERTDIRVLGRGRRLTPAWLAQREVLGLRASRKVALNNVSFVAPGGRRTVLLRNALHFLDDGEKRALSARLSTSLPREAAAVRLCARRADVVVVPCTAMGERVLATVPELGDRLEVRRHPVSQQAPRTDPEPVILCPVLPAPYKDIGRRIAELAYALEVHGAADARIVVTADRDDLPQSLRDDARVDAIGKLSPDELVAVWRSSMAIYFPTELESFGYPLAEARVSGHPVIALKSAQNEEIAGPALCSFLPDDEASLVEAVDRALSMSLAPDPAPFDPDAYFDWLLGPRG